MSDPTPVPESTVPQTVSPAPAQPAPQPESKISHLLHQLEAELVSLDHKAADKLRILVTLVKDLFHKHA